MRNCLKITLPLILSLLILPTLSLAGKFKVTKVYDGDSITVTGEGKELKVRLYGIDTPESTQWYGQKAKQFTSSQLFGKTISVDPIDIDRYGRTVALVSVGDLVINKLLVQYGYAWVYDRYCRKPFCAKWKQLEQEAREAKRGLIKSLFEAAHGTGEDDQPKDHQFQELRPQHLQTHPFQKYPPDDHQEVPEGVQKAQPLNQRGHIGDGKDKTAEHEERKDKEKCGHHGLLLSG
jgi:endonuclease YncB( thermonuclease family)